MNQTPALTGKPSIDKPWMKYYPQMLLDMIKLPKCTILEYLMQHCPGMDVAAIDYYGDMVTWKEIFDQTEIIARSMRAVGLKEGDQIPTFFKLVPEFVPMLLAAEKIGASILCRDNTLEENVEAVSRAGSKVIFAHDYLSQKEVEAYRAGGVEKIILVSPMERGSRDAMPDYVRACLDSCYPEKNAANYPSVSASKDEVIAWADFLAMADTYDGVVDAEVDISRPLYRCYTSGSTGPSKQVIHSADTMLSVICQMNFYGASQEFRPKWLTTCLPPALVAVVVSMLLLPMASGQLMIMDPFCPEHDVDLEVMRYKANNWPQLPLFVERVMRNKRVPDDYDMSHLLAGGAGSEAINNNQLRRAQKFFNDHGCKFRYTTGYGCSEGGSNLTLPMDPKPRGNGNVGVPMPLGTMGVFKPGTQIELGYNQIGEICVTSPCIMLGYDSPEATAKSLQKHEDGNTWLHVGDMGYFDEDGVLYTVGRGGAPVYTGGFADIQVMENLLADAEIEGIDDEFYVNVPDDEHEGYFLPYLYVVLKPGYTIADIEDKVRAVLEPSMQPVEIFSIPERPFWHFKTNRIGLSAEIQARRAAMKQ